MKRYILGFLVGIVAFMGTNVAVAAANGQPFQDLWDAIVELHLLVSEIELTPGPEGPHGPPGESAQTGAGNIAFTSGRAVLLLDGTVHRFLSKTWDAQREKLNVPIPVNEIVTWDIESFLDKDGNIWVFNDNTDTWIIAGSPNPNDNDPPVVFNINTLVSTTTATISFSTDEPAFIVRADLANAVIDFDEDNIGASHTIDITNLTYETSYSPAVAMRDLFDNQSTTSVPFTTELLEFLDISDLTLSSTTANSTFLSWTTATPTFAFVAYSTTTPVVGDPLKQLIGPQCVSGCKSTSRFFHLEGLATSTLYHVIAIGLDSSNPSSSHKFYKSEQTSFTTAP